jgi:dTDP-4-dehydrorhamnose reductase
MKILVTGSNGQLGAAIVSRFSNGHDVIGLTLPDLDIADGRAVVARVGREAPDVVVNCAAYNLVDRAEEEPLTALQVNSFAVRSLARAAGACGSAFVHYSSDFVFDGGATAPYDEQDEPNPRGVYAASKLLGDWFAAVVPRHYVLRVESLFGPPAPVAARKGSVDRIIEAIEQGQEVPAFVDRTVSPAYVVDVASATRALLERDAPSGLYHCVNSGHATWYELAGTAARLMGREAKLRRVTQDEAGLKVPRPRFCALSNRKLAGAGFEMPPWWDALGRHVRWLRSASGVSTPPR